MPARAQRRARRSGCPLAVGVVVTGDHEPREAGGRRERAEAAGRECGGGDGVRHRGDQRQHRLDALAHQQGTGGRRAEAHGEAVDAAERLARPRHGRLVRARGIEPRAVHAGNGPVGAGHGGDQRRQAAHAAAVAVEERGVEAKRREAAAVDCPGTQVGLGMGAVDGAAALPQAASRFRPVVGVGTAIEGRGRQGEEGASLGEGGAERARAGGDADEVEQIPVLAGRGVGPLARRCRAARGGRRASALWRRERRRRSSSVRCLRPWGR